uniref:Uncharacterized protein n=1 Tax=Strombidinopsis acuminata TaxID=141414 RepID=A0A7S3WYD2_9SPIT|mmetsp:Transcript_66291/g.91769  ORF Transcript_66291/g.91769 Transcript_66291/m.91769 type:complete len:670 (+) Transcript_66291:87-2096(+)
MVVDLLWSKACCDCHSEVSQSEQDRLVVATVLCDDPRTMLPVDHSRPTLPTLTRRKKALGLAMAALASCVALGVFAVHELKRERMGGLKNFMVLSKVDCNDKDMRILTDGETNPCESIDEKTRDMQKQLEELKKQQEELKQAAYLAAFQAKIERGECTGGLGNCNATKCCNSPHNQCYTQIPGGYAQCRQTCTTGGPDPTHWDSQPWECKTLGDRTPGDNSCTDIGEDCSKSQCCNDGGLQCYEKNKTFGSCKVDCVAGAPDMSDPDPKPWTCTALGMRSVSTQGWVRGECAKHGENCGKTKCCSEPGMQCYAQSDAGAEVFWGLCQEECNPGVDPRKPWEKAWSCHEIGTRTPTAPVKGSKLEKWALEPGACSYNDENCKDTKCCLGVDVQCYEKNKDYATCRRWCEPGEVDARNETWSCKPLSTRSWGKATVGWPSLFCFSLSRAAGYEVGIIKAQYDKQIGIFACDETAVLCSDEGGITLAPGVTSMHVEPAEITTSQDGTAGNAKLFVNVWRAIMKDGRFWNHAWTIKVDPDAVIMPPRMRKHMATYTGQNVFVVNCNKFSNSPNFPMMYGAMEIFSNKAMETYFHKGETCVTDMGSMLPKWGEDFYMTRCMDHIGVGRVGDWFSLGDQLCMGANCKDPRSASYHPFKDLGSWMQCHDDAVATDR